MAMHSGTSQPLTPAACLRRLPVPTLDIDEDNPLNDPRHIELRRSILAIAELDHVSEITLVQAVVAAVHDDEAAP